MVDGCTYHPTRTQTVLGVSAISGMRRSNMSLLQKVIEGVRDDFGSPASLRRVLAEHPALRAGLAEAPASIALSSLTRWEEIGSHDALSWPRRAQGELQCWQARGKHDYCATLVQCPEYAQIAQREVVQRWTCDIADVFGFGASKSNLDEFVSTDELVERKCPDLVSEISLEKLRENLAHDEIRIIHRRSTSDHFVRRRWDGRVYLANGGGSHHLAAAKYIAARLGERVSLTAALHDYSLNVAALAALRREFEMFVVGQELAAWIALGDALRAFRATWLWHPLPKPLDDGAVALLLPKAEDRSKKVARELHGAGFVDLGAHLAALVARQQGHA